VGIQGQSRLPVDPQPQGAGNIDKHRFGLCRRRIPSSSAPHRGLELVEETAEEISDVSRLLCKDIPPSNLRVMVSEGRRFPIVAVAFKFSANEDDIFTVHSFSNLSSARVSASETDAHR